MTNMDLSEKIVKLRKNNNLTQEQLAEQLNVSRQSVSKWESGQAAPDIDKIVAMGEIFHVTTDYLLKPSELDELAMKTEMLEKRQREILENEEKRKEKQYCICVCASIYIIAFAVFMLIRQVSWINDVLWNIFPGQLRCRSFYCSLPPRRQFLSVSGGSKGAGGWNHNRKPMRKKVREGLRQLRQSM